MGAASALRLVGNGLGAQRRSHVIGSLVITGVFRGGEFLDPFHSGFKKYGCTMSRGQLLQPFVLGSPGGAWDTPVQGTTSSVLDIKARRMLSGHEHSLCSVDFIS